MPRWRPKYKDEQQDGNPGESPLEILRKKIFQFLNSRLGWPTAASVVAIVVVWAGWDTVSKMPGIDWALTRGREMIITT
jgi:hypothetical protein